MLAHRDGQLNVLGTLVTPFYRIPCSWIFVDADDCPDILYLSTVLKTSTLSAQNSQVWQRIVLAPEESEALWQLSVALFAEEIACGVLAASCPDGTQAGSVLSMIHRAEGRSKASAFAERLRQVWLRKDATDPQPAGTADGLGLKVLARGRGVLVVDKPSGMLSEEVFECVSAQLRLPVSSTSRLDQPTSGILPVCLGSETAGATNWLRAQWAARLVSKSYLCLSAGSVMRVGFTAEVATALREVPGDLRLQEVSAAGRPARSPSCPSFRTEIVDFGHIFQLQSCVETPMQGLSSPSWQVSEILMASQVQTAKPRR